VSRLCKRVSLGVGRVGSFAAHGSGEIIVGFSTANRIPRRTRKMVYKMKILLDQRLDPLYEAVIEATEEAILNSMCMARPMEGINGNYCPALPLDEVRRFVDACRPIFASVKKKPQAAAAPASKERLADQDEKKQVRVGSALPTEVRGAEGIPFPTRPVPEQSPESGCDDDRNPEETDTSGANSGN
jgi:D-aminopeptidase